MTSHRFRVVLSKKYINNAGTWWKHCSIKMPNATFTYFLTAHIVTSTLLKLPLLADNPFRIRLQQFFWVSNDAKVSWPSVSFITKTILQAEKEIRSSPMDVPNGVFSCWASATTLHGHPLRPAQCLDKTTFVWSFVDSVQNTKVVWMEGNIWTPFLSWKSPECKDVGMVVSLRIILKIFGCIWIWSVCGNEVLSTKTQCMLIHMHAFKICKMKLKNKIKNDALSWATHSNHWAQYSWYILTRSKAKTPAPMPPAAARTWSLQRRPDSCGFFFDDFKQNSTNYLTTNIYIVYIVPVFRKIEPNANANANENSQ